MTRALALGLMLLAAPVLAQDVDDPEFSYVMVMQFNDCSMAEADLISQLQDVGVDQAGYAAVSETLVARGDAVVTDEPDGTRRVAMPEHACAPVEMGEWEVASPQSEEERKAQQRQDVFVSVLAANGCTMTEAQLVEEMPKYGLDLVQAELTEALLAAGSATLSPGDDGSQRVTLGPEICTPGAPVQMLPVKAENVAKLTDYMRANGCALEIEKMEAIEAELGLEPAESSNIALVMDLRGDARMDFETGLIRLINKDCP